MSRSELDELLTKLLDNSATAEETNQLMEVAADPQQQELLHEAIGDQWQQWKEKKQYNARLSDFASEQLFARIRQSILPKEETVKEIKAPVRTLWKWVAAAAIILSVGGYLWTSEKLKVKSSNTTVLTSEPGDVAPPALAYATVALADGRTLRLDSVTTGAVTLQDEVKLTKTAEGELKYSGKTATTQYNTLNNPRGSRVVTLTLADGTRVWLNAASAITYPTAFSEATREVTITGEAYLEVAKDKTHPFIVKTPTERITVLGTAFNVSAYPDEIPKTSLAEGSITISESPAPSRTSAPLREIKLKSGEAYSNGKVTHTNIAQDLAWKNGFFHFESASLQTVMKQVSRWYDIDVKYEGPIPTEQFQGELNRNLSLMQVMKLLSYMDIKYRLENRTLIVTQ